MCGYDRLRELLEPEVRIERVVRENDEEALYLARDMTLQRPVLIKAIDTSRAGEPSIQRFVQEARILAALSSPHIPAIHHAAVAGDCRYVVREPPDGPTLQERLREGALAPDDVARMGLDLLRALETAHGGGFAHGAVHAANVIVGETRFLLDGFGSAAESTAEAVRRDLEAVVELLQVAAGGALPGSIRDAIARPGALTSAATLGALLDQAAHRGLPRRRARHVVAIAFSGALALYAITAARDESLPPGPAPRALAVLPLEVDGSQSLDQVGINLAQLIQLSLEEVPGLELTPWSQVDRWWRAQSRKDQPVDGFTASRALRAHWVAHGIVDRGPGEMLRVRISLYDSSGGTHPLPERRAPATDIAALSDSLGLAVIRVVAPHFDRGLEAGGGLTGVPLPALKAFLRGEAALARDAWALAQREYESAVGLDSTFALADWRLANVRRWRERGDDSELARVYERHAPRLRPRDRLLLEALLDRDLEARLTRLDTAVQRFPSDGYVRLLQGEELFHRGPLTGRALEEALHVMGAAVARDSSLALAYDHLVLGNVRLGREAEARRMLELRRRVGEGGSQEDLDLLPFLHLVHDERFVPWRAWARYQFVAWRRDPRQLTGIERIARVGTPWLDMPRTQLRYCDLLLRAGPADPQAHATAHEGKGLALFALGRVDDALAELDSAAALFDSPEARLRQAQWRVVPVALGIPGPSTTPWEQMLSDMAGDSILGDRAAWTLALLRAGDSTWVKRVKDGSPLRALAEARLAGSRGNFARALALSDSVRVEFQRTRPPDPFAGAVFHLFRGDWLAAAGHWARADREWLWYEASDVEGWPVGPAQAGEVDAALGVYGRLKRARAGLRAGAAPEEVRQACGHLARLRELWAGAAPARRPLDEEVKLLARRCPS